MQTGPWTFLGAMWELLWVLVALGLAYVIAYKFGDRLLEHAAEQQRIANWHKVGRAARGRLHYITIQIALTATLRGFPARGLGAGAFQAWADGIRAILARRPGSSDENPE